MKKLILVLCLSVFAPKAFACMGGRAVLDNGNIVLTAENVDAEVGIYGTHSTTQQMLKDETTVRYQDKEEGAVVEISVDSIKADGGGVIYTIYKLSYDRKGNYSEKYIKVESNYKGNGVRAKGMQPVEPEISKVYSC